MKEIILNKGTFIELFRSQPIAVQQYFNLNYKHKFNDIVDVVFVSKSNKKDKIYASFKNGILHNTKYPAIIYVDEFLMLDLRYIVNGTQYMKSAFATTFVSTKPILKNQHIIIDSFEEDNITWLTVLTSNVIKKVPLLREIVFESFEDFQVYNETSNFILTEINNLKKIINIFSVIGITHYELTIINYTNLVFDVLSFLKTKNISLAEFKNLL